MPEVVLRRDDGPDQIHEVVAPLPKTLTVEGRRYVAASGGAPVDGRPVYLHVREAPLRVDLCFHGCAGCGAVEPCGEIPCPFGGTWRTRPCDACVRADEREVD